MRNILLTLDVYYSNIKIPDFQFYISKLVWEFLRAWSLGPRLFCILSLSNLVHPHILKYQLCSTSPKYVLFSSNLSFYISPCMTLNVDLLFSSPKSWSQIPMNHLYPWKNLVFSPKFFPTQTKNIDISPLSHIYLNQSTSTCLSTVTEIFIKSTHFHFY